jgi:fructose-specific phosphotransferase system IIA component
LSIASINLADLIEPARILELEAQTKEDVLRLLCDRLTGDHRVLDSDAFYEAILERERQISTGIGMGVAIPHVKIPQLTDYVIAVGRSRKGVDFDAMDQKPVHLIFLIGASERQTKEFIHILARVTHLLKHDGIRQALLRADIPGDFLSIIKEHEG